MYSDAEKRTSGLKGSDVLFDDPGRQVKGKIIGRFRRIKAD